MSDFQQRLQHALGDDYVIERELGGGGMSRVFVATERALGRRVVVKVLPPDLSAGVNTDRFRREIQLAAQLQHPHIVPVLSAGEEGELLWYTMPYIEGESLRATLAQRGRLAPRDVVRILHDVVDALAYAHARGIIHRDIKPGNILTSGLHALVTDFGVAKALSAAIPMHSGGTTAGMAIGTPAYMAPEQLAADPAADHRVDIYATGLLAYELLTGRAPFAGSSPQATLAAQLTQLPDPPHRTLPDVPEALSALVMRCLQKDPARRLQTAGDLLAALEALPTLPSGAVPARRAVAIPILPIAAGLLVALGGAARAFTHQAERATAGGVGGAPVLAPRDAGPGGGLDTSVRLEPPVAPTVVSGGIVRVDTVVVYRDLVDVPDARRPTQVPVVITRAESIAIAEAVRRRLAVEGQAPPRDAAPADPTPLPGGQPGVPRSAVPAGTHGGAAPDTRSAWVAEIQRVFSDSLARAMAQHDTALRRIPRVFRLEESPRGSGAVFVSPVAAPPAPGQMRVVVTTYQNRTRRRDLDSLGADAEAALRSALATRGDVEVADAGKVAQVQRAVPDRMALGWSLRADFVVGGAYLLRGDSLAVVTHFTDVRRGQASRWNETVLPLAESPRAFGQAATLVLAWMDSARAAAPPRPPRGRGPDAGDGRRQVGGERPDAPAPSAR